MTFGYPVNLDLNGRRCLVVGGGNIAERKVYSLLDCQAEVLVVSPKLTAGLNAAVDSNLLHYRQGCFQEDDLNGVVLAVCATSDPELNKQVAELCALRNIWVNVVDAPQLCSFIVPAVVRRGELCISVSTGGQSPLLARRIREELELLYGPQFAELVGLLGEARRKIISETADADRRQQLMLELIDVELLYLARENNLKAVKERVATCTSW